MLQQNDLQRMCICQSNSSGGGVSEGEMERASSLMSQKEVETKTMKRAAANDPVTMSQMGAWALYTAPRKMFESKCLESRTSKTRSNAAPKPTRHIHVVMHI